MEKNYLIQLTNELYRLTLLFPKKEPLRYKMRELADDILADSLRIMGQSESTNKTEINQHPRLSNSVLGDLEVLDGFFEVAKNQNWVSPSEILKLQQEYSKLKEGLKELKSETSYSAGSASLPLFQEEGKTEEKVKVTEVGSPPMRERDSRHQKILEILKEKGKAQVWEFKKIFPEVTKRTLRRDFEQLLKQGLIERMGERNDTFYKLKG